jgi:hypothetical protein
MGKDHQEQATTPETAAPKASTASELLLAEMLALMRELRTDNATMRAEMAALKEEAKIAAEGPKRPEPIVPKMQAWEEEIWVEAMRDCTYPDTPSPLDPEGTYGVYRKSGQDGNIGAIFRLKYREHLADHMRELAPDEVADNKLIQRKADRRQQVPQTTARGVKLTQQF